MKSLKLFIYLFAMFIEISAGHAQDIINLIPNQTTFVGVLNMSQINTKAKFDELIKLPLFDKIDNEIGKNLFNDYTSEDKTSYLDLQQHGISKTGKTYFYVNNSGNLYYGALVFAIEDQAKFAHFAELLNGTSDSLQIITADTYKYIKKNKITIVWNSKSAAIFGASVLPSFKDSVKNSILYPPANYIADTTVSVTTDQPINDEVVNDQTSTETPDYNENNTNEYPVEDTTSAYNYYNDYAVTDSTNAYDYNTNYTDPYNDAYVKSNAICDSIENAWCIANAGIILQDKGTNSLAANTEFSEYLKSSPDAALMFDYGQFIDMSTNSISQYGMYSLSSIPLEYIKGFYKGLKMYAKVELNSDDVRFAMDMKHTDKINEIYKEVKKTKISKNFLKYMDKDLMGYYAVGIDIEGLAKGFGSTLKKVYPEVPKYGKIASSAMDVLDIIIDEQAIYKVFTGDMVFAVNGVKPVEVIHKTYDYDENYNMTERMDTSMQMQPEILLMLGVGNVADVTKILKLLISLDALKQEGDLYELSYRNSDLPVYLKIQDDILFISNNKNFVEKPEILAKDKLLGKEHTKMFNENSYIAYANTSKIAQYFAKQGKSEDDKILTEAAELFSSIKMLGKSKNGYSSASCVFELSKTDDNSLVDILKFINNLYIAKGKKL